MNDQSKYMRIIGLRLILLFVLLGSFNTLAFSQTRTAIVIGNSNYLVGPLKNPANDAKAMTLQLKKMGFDVTTIIDAPRKVMVKSIRRWGQTLKKNDIGLFYYAGHGLQLNGQNYLVPIDAEIDSEENIEFESVSLGEVLNQMGSAKNSANIIILDACRNNPFKTSFRSSVRGLQRVEGPSGTIIAYSTSPQSVADDGKGSNGLYTTHLLRAMEAPGRPIEFVFKDVAAKIKQITNGKQIPWYSAGSFTGEFSFVISSDNQMSNADPFEDSISISIEKEFWNEVKTINTPEMYEEYIKQYPDGRYLKLANLMIHRSRPTSKSEIIAKPSKSEKEFYNEAFSYMTEDDFTNAIKSFSQLLENYPRGNYSDLAQFWLGHAYYSSSELDTALVEFEKVTNNYPRSKKAPESLLKQAIIHRKIKQLESAKIKFSRIIKKYPTSSAANIARKRLADMFSKGY